MAHKEEGDALLRLGQQSLNNYSRQRPFPSQEGYERFHSVWSVSEFNNAII